jgi:hypothetical protein
MKSFPLETIFIQLIKSHKDGDGDIILTRKPKLDTFLKKIFGQPNQTIQLDQIGTIVWNYCDGKTIYKNMYAELKKIFPNEKKLKQRVNLYLFHLIKLEFIKPLLESITKTDS